MLSRKGRASEALRAAELKRASADFYTERMEQATAAEAAMAAQAEEHKRALEECVIG